jgi:hypothetical protein
MLINRIDCVPDSTSHRDLLHRFNVLPTRIYFFARVCIDNSQENIQENSDERISLQNLKKALTYKEGSGKELLEGTLLLHL